jgi:hypothetical protein
MEAGRNVDALCLNEPSDMRVDAQRLSRTKPFAELPKWRQATAMPNICEESFTCATLKSYVFLPDEPNFFLRV